MLPDLVAGARADSEFGIYLHVPFCATRCGYCDFNTYTAGELGSSASPQSWFDAVQRELVAAKTRLGDAARPATTVFVGGGTPSLLGGDGLTSLLHAVRETFGLADGAEITTESNPESTSPEFFAHLRAAGFTRISLGMQSAADHVLRVLDRTHSAGRAAAAAREAIAAGFEHVNLDLIYGTPGEQDADLRQTLDEVLAAGVDHVSAYALIVEEGTALARRIRRGEVAPVDDDVLAARYEIVATVLEGAGFAWYEVSNWARSAAARCHHNELYWRGADWWGFGPGAHSHIGGVRFWNVKHPARYADALISGDLPVAGFEELTPDEQHMEAVMLRLRLADGLPVSVLRADERARVEREVAVGNVIATAGTVVLTDAGRLVADGVVRRLLG